MAAKLARYLFFFTVLSLSFTSAFSQGGRIRAQIQEQRREQRMNQLQNRVEQRPGVKLKTVQQVKEEFVNRQLNLTPEQSERFVPLYHQYQQEMNTVRRLKHQNEITPQQNSADQINRGLAYDRELVEIRTRYTTEFLKIMPPDKVNQIQTNEHYFNQTLLQEVGTRNGQPVPPPED